MAFSGPEFKGGMGSMWSIDGVWGNFWEVVWFLEMVAAEIVSLSSKGMYGPGIDCFLLLFTLLFCSLFFLGF